MKLMYLGGPSEDGGSPSLYATDRGTYVVQGWKVDDAEALAEMQIPVQETVVEIPQELLRFAPRQN